MKQELYQNIFDKLSELNCIRKDLSPGCHFTYEVEWYTTRNGIIWEYWHYYNNGWDLVFNTWIDWFEEIKEYKIIGHIPILSDCLNWIYKSKDKQSKTNIIWDYTKPFLINQSDDLWDSILENLIIK